MASAKEYGYFIKGSKLALIEKDTALDNDVNSRDYGPDVTNVRFKSPQSTVADGIELEYIYSPKYFIETTNDVAQNLTQYQSVDGKLAIADNTSSYTNYATTYGLATGGGDYIVLRKAGRFNGLHKISSIGNGPAGTNNKIILTTKYSGSEAAWTDFERTPDLYYAIDVLNDEADTLPISEYLSNTDPLSTPDECGDCYTVGHADRNMACNDCYDFNWDCGSMSAPNDQSQCYDKVDSDFELPTE